MIKNIKRMFSFLKGYEGTLILGIFMIVLVQLLEFASPLIVKRALDDCILGIEYDWVEIQKTDELDDYSVLYQNRVFKQVRDQDEDDIIMKEISVVVYKNGYYFVDEKIIEGTKTVENDILTVNNKQTTETYQCSRLSKEEVASFYNPIYKTLIIMIILLFVRSVLSIVFSYIQKICNNRIISHIAQEGRTRAFTAAERLPISYYESEPAGKMASRITRDVDGMLGCYRTIVNVVFNCIISFIFAYAGMFILDYKLALLTFLAYPIIFIWIKFFLGKLRKIAEKVNELRSLLTAKINEIINGINILQIFNYKKQTIDEYDELNRTFIKEQLSEVKLHATFGYNLVNVVKACITVLIVVYFGLNRINLGGMVITAGLIYAYNEYLLKIANPVVIIFDQVGTFEHAMVQTERIHKLIEGELEDDTKVDIPKYKGEIEFKNVWFSYVDDNYVLKGIDFHILPGQSIGLVGHTGSGKTSLMSLLLRFYDLKPDGGEILVDGENITTHSKRSYRESIGIVLQEPVLFKGTIASNIRFGKEGVSDEEIEQILISIGGKKIIDKFEDGIHQNISRIGGNMSCGEKQIIALARVLVHDPSILIMDEATSHIDTETEQMIKHALTVVRKNRTMILIAHRLSTVQDCDNIIVLDHGLKVEEGTHQELIEKNGTYANIYRAQVVSDNN